MLIRPTEYITPSLLLQLFLFLSEYWRLIPVAKGQGWLAQFAPTDTRKKESKKGQFESSPEPADPCIY